MIINQKFIRLIASAVLVVYVYMCSMNPSPHQVIALVSFMLIR